MVKLLLRHNINHLRNRAPQQIISLVGWCQDVHNLLKSHVSEKTRCIIQSLYVGLSFRRLVTLTFVRNIERGAPVALLSELEWPGALGSPKRAPEKFCVNISKF